MITTIDRVTLRKLRDDINAAVQAVAKKNGVEIKPSGGTYGDNCGTIKLEISTVGQDGTVNTREAADFKQYASLFNFKPEDFGKVFIHDSNSFKICGLKIRARKSPILAQRTSDGRRFKFRADYVLRLIGRPQPRSDGRAAEAMQATEKFAQ